MLSVIAITFGLLLIVYHGIFSSDVYRSESKIVIKGDNSAQESSLANILAMGDGRSTNAAIVKEFITSKNALLELDKKFGLREKYSSVEYDIISRFNPLGLDSSIENFSEYMNEYVIVSIDEKSSILSVTVKCFEKELCVKINNHMIEQSEYVVNKLNDRSRIDALNTYLETIKSLESKRDSVASDLEEFRKKEGVIDIGSEVKIRMEILLGLEQEYAQLNDRLATLREITSKSSQVKIVQSQLGRIENEINRIRSEISGVSVDSLARKNSGYSKLINENILYEKIIAAAISAYESQVSVSSKKNIYLETISNPTVPESAEEPRRLRSIFKSIFLVFIFYIFAKLVRIAIREHSDK